MAFVPVKVEKGPYQPKCPPPSAGSSGEPQKKKARTVSELPDLSNAIAGVMDEHIDALVVSICTTEAADKFNEQGD